MMLEFPLIKVLSPKIKWPIQAIRDPAPKLEVPRNSIIPLFSHKDLQYFLSKIPTDPKPIFIAPIVLLLTITFPFNVFSFRFRDAIIYGHMIPLIPK